MSDTAQAPRADYIRRSEAELEQIRKWFKDEGKSATEIARLRNLGETRNMIMGVINRNQWTRGPVANAATQLAAKVRDTIRKREERAEAQRKRAAAIAALPVKGMPVLVAATPPKSDNREGPTLLELGANQCRSPVGPDVRVSGRPQMFCGDRVQVRDLEVVKGQFRTVVDSYCAACAMKNRTTFRKASTAPEFMRNVRRFA